jgi:hypothetical protein
VIGWFKGLFFHPAIARLSDDQFDHYAQQARARRGDAIWVVPLALGVLAAGAWLLLAGVLIEFVQSAGTLPAPAPQLQVVPGTPGPAQLFGGPATQVALVTPVSGAVRAWWGTNVVVALLIAAAVVALAYYALLLASIRALANRGGCPYCEFSLAGLAIGPDNAVTCPECGQRVYLHEHRIKREDIETGALAPLPGPGPRGAYR